TYQTPSTTSDLVITVGVAAETEISPELIADLNTAIINIDYSLDNTGFGNVALIDTTASSYAEIVAKLLADAGLPIEGDIA
ncbi:hypothetical protein, partial [Staphylococcus aureus]